MLVRIEWLRESLECRGCIGQLEFDRRELTRIAYSLAKFLRHNGWQAFNLPVAKQNPRFRTSRFYHIPARYLVGRSTLGWNCTILTPQFGPRVKVISIITDCALPAGESMAQSM